MAKPRVFISSTFSDLSEIRNKVRDYVVDNGYEPVCFEKDEIPYTPNKSLEESCYEEVKECTMFINKIAELEQVTFILPLTSGVTWALNT